MYLYKNQVNKVLKATTTESSKVINALKVAYISNNSTTGNLLVRFDDHITAEDYMIIEPGSHVSYNDNEEIACHTLYYKSDAGEVSFQIIGFKEDR